MYEEQGYSCLGGLVARGSCKVVFVFVGGGDWYRCESMGQRFAAESGFGPCPCGEVADVGM